MEYFSSRMVEIDIIDSEETLSKAKAVTMGAEGTGVGTSQVAY